MIAIDNQYNEQDYTNSLVPDELSMSGKTPEEMREFLLSGESDDLSNEYFDS